MDKYKVTHLIMKHFFRKEHFQKVVVKIKKLSVKKPSIIPFSN